MSCAIASIRKPVIQLYNAGNSMSLWLIYLGKFIVVLSNRLERHSRWPPASSATESAMKELRLAPISPARDEDLTVALLASRF